MSFACRDRRKYGPVIGGVVGIGLSIWLLDSFGIARVLGLLRSVGWFGMLAVIAVHPIQMLLSALGWRDISEPGARVGLHAYFLLRWIREAINNLLPLAQIGGEFVAARLLQHRGVKLAPAIAGTVADLTVEMASQLLFTGAGLLLLLRTVGSSAIVDYVSVGLAVATIALALLAAALRWGAAGAVERAWLRLGRSLGWAGSGDIEGFNAALLACYRARGRLVSATLWHLLSWLLGGVEVCIALHFLGYQAGIGQGLAIESIGQALKAVGFAVPGALGIQEGGYIIVCRAFGLSAEVAIALSLCKRLREVALGVPALIFWQRTRHKAQREHSAPLHEVVG